MESDAMEEDDGSQQNGHRAASVFTRKLTKRAPSVRETVDGPPEPEDDFDQYRVQVTTMIRYVFETEDEVDSFINPKNQAVKKFIQLVKKIKKAEPKHYERIIKDECRFRLNFMVEDVSSHSDDRYRVLIFFVLTALRLYYDHNEDFILHLMLDYAILSSNAESSTVRASCLRICSRLLLHWLIDPIGKDENKHMEPIVRNQIYANLRSRQQDKAISVRHSCVLAVAEIQDMEISSDFRMGIECSPKDMLFRACQDLSLQVQLAAVSSIDLTHCTEYHIDKLMGLACAAQETATKQEAVKKLGQLELNRFNPEKLLDTLQAVLEDVEEEVVETAKRFMLTEWLVRMAVNIARDNGHPTGRRNDGDAQSGEPLLGVGSAILCFLNQMECPKWNGKRDIIVFALLDCARWMIYPKKKRLNIAELIIHLITDKCTPMIWSRFNKGPVLKDRLDHQTVAVHLYLWRCMVQYCDRETKPGMPEDDAALRDECFQRLLCPLTTMVDILEAVWKRDELDTYDRLPLLPEDQLNYMKSIAEAINLCNFLSSDPHEKKKYLDLLTEIILNPNNHMFLTNLIGCSLLNILHNQEKEVGVVDPPKCICQKHLEMLLDRSRLFVALNREVDENNRTEMSQEERTAIIAYAVQAMYGMLSNNGFHMNYPFMDKLLNKLLQNRDARAHEKTRGLVIKCMTVWMLSSEPVARKYYAWLENCSEKTETSKNKAVAINCMYDLLHHFGEETYESWRSKIGHKDTWITDMGYLLFNYRQEDCTLDEDYFLAHCEVACKFMLNDENNPNPCTGELAIVTSMCEQYFQPYGTRNKKFRQMFVQFAMLYIQKSRTNIVRVTYGLLSTISRMMDSYSEQKTDDNIPTNKRVTLGDLEVIINAAGAWCREELLLQEVTEEEVNSPYLQKHEVNSLFLQYFMRKMRDTIENDGIVDLCMRIISAQDPSKVPECLISAIQYTLMEVFEVMDEYYGPKHHYRQILTKLQQELDKYFEVEIKEEIDDACSDATSNTARTVRRRNLAVPTKQRKFISIQKYRNIKKIVEFEDRGLNPEPEEAPTSSRAHLARNVRRKNFDLETLVED